MKKYLLSTAALLLGLLAYSQEADDLGNHAEITIIPRLDLGINAVKGSPDESGFNLGNSSLYTLFEGSASEHFSWTLANHWFQGEHFLGSNADPFALFKGLGHSDTTNWIDFMKVDLTFGSWTFTLGKDSMSTGGFEYEPWDWDVHPVTASPLWNDLSPYQWGAKVAWTTPSELTTLSLQMTTSPFGERPFGSGLWTGSFQWRGEYDWYAPIWSVSLIGTAPRQNAWLVSLGNQFLLGDWTLTLDWSNTSGINEDYNGFLHGCNFHGVVEYAPSERFDLSVRGNYAINYDHDLAPNWFKAGAVFQFYPLRESQDLRVHALAQYNSLMQGLEATIGITYNFRIKLW
ncbi:MAG: hypothetical protein IJV37_01560 [Bacteroidales bacterium]|nr:hypothetical protein [Bacteroidales bacterium]